MDEPTKSAKVAHATPALIDGVRDLGRFADRYRLPNAAVVLVVGSAIVVRVPLTDNVAFRTAGWECVREKDGLWALDMRDPKFLTKRHALSRLTSAFDLPKDS